MNNWEIVGKIATFFAIATFVLLAVSAATSYLILAMFSTAAPLSYITLYILNSLVPYLVIAVLAVIVAIMAKRAVEDQQQKALPQEEESEEVNA